MIRAFFDASVLFAASYSPTGASRELIRLAFRGKVQLVMSDDVLEEVERNLAARYPDTLDLFHLIVEVIPFDIVTPTPEEVQHAATYTEDKDAPIVAAAKRAKADYLTSLDKRHLVGVPEVAQRAGLKIVLPRDLLEEVRRQSSAEQE